MKRFTPQCFTFIHTNLKVNLLVRYKEIKHLHINCSPLQSYNIIKKLQKETCLLKLYIVLFKKDANTSHYVGHILQGRFLLKENVINGIIRHVQDRHFGSRKTITNIKNTLTEKQTIVATILRSRSRISAASHSAPDKVVQAETEP